MAHILVADKIAEAGLEKLRAASGVTFDVRHGLSAEELALAVGEYDGMLIRSAVKVTAEVLANPGKLSAIARAGVGVDNVDLDAATAAGVLVLNTPDANTLSTAEHAMALMLALHRNIPDAHAHIRGGGWDRSKYLGEQLAGKTLGIVGLGRIGRAVAARALAFEMRVIGFDPFVKDATLLDGAVAMVKELPDFLGQADCITLHASLTDDTKHMIGAEELAAMKPGAHLVNCARGKLIDEAALANALNEDRIAGAAIDVYEKEPPEGSPLLSAKNVVLTPHLAASTAEAQSRVSTDAVEALLAYLLHGEISSAVNVSGLPSSLPPRDKAYLDLCGRMGTIISPLCAGGVESISVSAFGDLLAGVAPTLSWQAAVAILKPHVPDRLNLINAADQARHRGITVEHAAHSSRQHHADSILIKVKTKSERHEIEGTVFADEKPRVLSIDGYRMELVPEGAMALIFNDDQPGVIGLVGRQFGDSGINIADMALSRRENKALMVLKLDASMPVDLRTALQSASPPIHSIYNVSLPDVKSEDP